MDYFGGRIEWRNAIVVLFTFISVQFSFSQIETGAIRVSNDFDFLIGEWNVNSRVLKSRLKGDSTWIESNFQVATKSQLNGMVVFDEWQSSQNGDTHSNGVYRIYNSKSKEWSFYFISTAYPEWGLLPQVKGRFENGKGVFYGEEMYADKMVKLRYLWLDTDTEEPRWEQAYFDEVENNWETNWVMELKRN